jgi:hypothetical protein
MNDKKVLECAFLRLWTQEQDFKCLSTKNTLKSLKKIKQFYTFTEIKEILLYGDYCLVYIRGIVYS